MNGFIILLLFFLVAFQLMSAYLVSVSTYYPYKIEFSYTEKGSNHAVAIARAVRKFRKEEKIAGRKIKEVTVKATRLNGV